MALRGDMLPTARPDLDNYVKTALDAINTIVIHDDCQITELVARKRFSEQPKLIARVFPLTPALRIAHYRPHVATTLDAINTHRHLDDAQIVDSSRASNSASTRG